MAETIRTDPPDKLPLTVGEIITYQRPANLAGWVLTQDTAGGYSYRTKLNGISYIATPEEWEGRTLTTKTGASSMGNFATNGVLDLTSQTPGTLETNDPRIDRNLVPTDTGTTIPAANPAASCSTYQPAILIGVAVVVTFFLTSAFAGLLYFAAGRRSHGNA